MQTEADDSDSMKKKFADRKKGLDQIRWKRLVSTYGLSVN